MTTERRLDLVRETRWWMRRIGAVGVAAVAAVFRVPRMGATRGNLQVPEGWMLLTPGRPLLGYEFWKEQRCTMGIHRFSVMVEINASARKILENSDDGLEVPALVCNVCGLVVHVKEIEGGCRRAW
jgi:hypothetical protein